MANIDKGFNVELISLGDRTLITSGELDPRVGGYEAPEGSLFAYKNGIDSTLLIKTGVLDTDWLTVPGTSGTTTSHTVLTDREAADQHPISAITNLQTTLDAKVDLSGDSMTGSLSLPKTKGEGLLIDDSFAWMDIIGAINPKTLGTTAAVLLPYRDQVEGWAHHAGSRGQLVYHIPHDYAPGSNVFLHVHWGHNGTSIQGSLVIKYWLSYAKRVDGITEPFGGAIKTSVTVSGITMTTHPQYAHSVNEIQISTPGGAVNMIDSNLIEPDGVLLVHYEVDTIPSIGGSSVINVPYIQTFDLHMQTTNVGTKNKDPNFWA